MNTLKATKSAAAALLALLAASALALSGYGAQETARGAGAQSGIDYPVFVANK